MSPEFWAIIGVGVAVLGLGWRAFESLRRDNEGLRGEIAAIKERLARVEATLELLVKGLHIETQDRPR